MSKIPHGVGDRNHIEMLANGDHEDTSLRVKSTEKMIQNEQKQELAGFFAQLRILMWKNTVLFRRNVSGTLSEIICPMLFVLAMLLIRYFVDNIRLSEQKFTATSALDLIPSLNTSYILYYPNNAFVLGLVNRAVDLIKQRKPTLNPSGNSFQ